MAMWPQFHVLRNQKLLQILALLIPQGFILTINGVASPWMLASFGLTASQLAKVFAWISISGLGSLALTRLFDVLGRGRVISWSVLIASLSATGAAAARSVTAFVTFEIILAAASGAVIAGAPVVIAESLEPAERATGQSWGGIALGAGAGACMLMLPILLRLNLSWRFLLLIAALPILSSPWMMTQSWQRQFWHPPRGAEEQEGALLDLLRPPQRRRAVTFMVSSVFSTIAIATAKSWSYFHCVASVGIAPAAASAILILAGGFAIAGFPLGAALCERLGRVATVAIFAILVAASIMFSFRAPLHSYDHPFLWLLVGFSLFGLAANAATVAWTASATELFPVTLRATAAGAIAIAGTVGRIAGQSLVAFFAVGTVSISSVVSFLGLAAIATSLLFKLFIEESRGLVLDSTAVSSIS